MRKFTGAFLFIAAITSTAHAQEITTALSIASAGSGPGGPYPSAEFRASFPTSNRFAVEPFVTLGSKRQPARGFEGFYGVQVRQRIANLSTPQSYVFAAYGMSGCSIHDWSLIGKGVTMPRSAPQPVSWRGVSLASLLAAVFLASRSKPPECQTNAMRRQPVSPSVSRRRPAPRHHQTGVDRAATGVHSCLTDTLSSMIISRSPQTAGYKDAVGRRRANGTFRDRRDSRCRGYG